MPIIGTHALIYSSAPAELRALLREGFGFNAVDAGEGWLIFALPPAELGVHPAANPEEAAETGHQLALMCRDIAGTIRELGEKGVRVRDAPVDRGWGVVAVLTLPGGAEMMLYEPKHPLAIETEPPA